VPGQSQHKLEQLQSYFKANPYEDISQQELAKAKQLLNEEMAAIGQPHRSSGGGGIGS